MISKPLFGRFSCVKKRTILLKYLQQDLDEQDNSALEVKAVCAEYPIAGSEVTVIEIQLDQPLDKMNIYQRAQRTVPPQPQISFQEPVVVHNV
ncbi:hypothetical protein YQE_04666, partial [Dendroctonus ponderosae]